MKQIEFADIESDLTQLESRESLLVCLCQESLRSYITSQFHSVACPSVSPEERHGSWNQKTLTHQAGSKERDSHSLFRSSGHPPR